MEHGLSLGDRREEDGQRGEFHFLVSLGDIEVSDGFSSRSQEFALRIRMEKSWGMSSEKRGSVISASKRQGCIHTTHRRDYIR